MSGIVRNIHPAKDLEDFLEFLYGKDSGYVHIPLKEPTTSKWDNEFYFSWPEQKQAIVDHVERFSKAVDVYIGPALLSKKDAHIDSFQGSHVVWAEFDGNIPTIKELEEASIPEPTLRVQSSMTGREHWYWRLDKYCTDLKAVQDTNKGITYALGADLSGWDACQVLRPVGSYNHKREEPTEVFVRHRSHQSYEIEAFSKVPVPEDVYRLEDFKRDLVPKAVNLLFRYSWNSEEQAFMSRPKQPEGKRSSALMRLAYMCCEKSLDNNEVFSLLEWADLRWGKFRDRPNKEKYYVNIINHARIKIPYEGLKSTGSSLLTRGFKDVLTYTESIDYIIDGVLPQKGLLYVCGRSGVGKTIVTMGLGIKLALGSQYLKWEATDRRPRRIMFISLEMNTAECKNNYLKMSEQFTDEELELLQENFQTYSEAEPIKFYIPEHVARFASKVVEYKPDVVIVDTAGVAMARKMTDEEQVNASIQVMHKLRNKFSFSMIMTHHTRKDPPGHGYREAALDDVFGSQYIAASASTVISVKPSQDYTEENPVLDVCYIKTRFRGSSESFAAVLDPKTLTFNQPTIGEIIAAAPLPKQKRTKQKASIADDKSDPSGSMFSGKV